jgi:hypothetical protein
MAAAAMAACSGINRGIWRNGEMASLGGMAAKISWQHIENQTPASRTCCSFSARQQPAAASNNNKWRMAKAASAIEKQ